MKRLLSFLALTTAATHAHPGHPGHEVGDIGWGSHPVLALSFVVLLTAAVLISRRIPRAFASVCAAVIAVALIFVR